MTENVENPSRWNRAALIAIGLTWLVTAVLVVHGARIVRDRARAQIVGREAVMLQAMARAVRASEADNPISFDDPLPVLARMRHLDGVLAARLFDRDGAFLYSLPGSVREAEVPGNVLESLRLLRPVSWFRDRMLLADILLVTNTTEWLARAEPMPAVEVFVPLQRVSDQELDGVAWFLLDGRSMAREFTQSDGHLWLQAGLILVAALSVIGSILGWTFHRLARANRLLASRTGDLQRANQELSQSARVAALGAVTAHLLHGLKSPVSGLQMLVASKASAGSSEAETWVDALEATRRMQALIQQVVRVLAEQESNLAYQVKLKEVAEAVVERTLPLARQRGVRLEIEGDSGDVTDNRTASLLILMLSNLVENGIEATAEGNRVVLRISRGSEPVFEVEDEGCGLNPAVQERLFQPQRSTREGGSGLGLAITRQLALALGGSVRLISTGDSGTLFRVEVPGSPVLQSAGKLPDPVGRHD